MVTTITRRCNANIGVAKIFSAVHFLLDQTSDDVFLVITLSYMIIYVIHYHQLPFYIICRSCTSPNSAPFLPHSNKNTQKKCFRRPGGCNCTPCTALATPVNAKTLRKDSSSAVCPVKLYLALACPCRDVANVCASSTDLTTWCAHKLVTSASQTSY